MIKYGQIDDFELCMDLLYDQENTCSEKPCIIWIHGGSWCCHELTRSFRPDNELMNTFVKRGYVIASIDYRLTDEAAFPAQIEDCKCAIRFLRANAKKYGIDENHIFAWGESAGGHLAELLGTTNGYDSFEGNGGYSEFSSKINGVCAWYAPCKFDTLCENKDTINLAQCLLQDDPLKHPEMIKYISPYYYISSNTVPFLIMHGTSDSLVPIEQSELFVNELHNLSNNKIEFIQVEGQGHGFFEGHEYYEQVYNFFESIK